MKCLPSINGYLYNHQMEARGRLFNSNKYPVYIRLAETAMRPHPQHPGTGRAPWGTVMFKVLICKNGRTRIQDIKGRPRQYLMPCYSFASACKSITSRDFLKLGFIYHQASPPPYSGNPLGALPSGEEHPPSATTKRPQACSDVPRSVLAALKTGSVPTDTHCVDRRTRRCHKSPSPAYRFCSTHCSS